MKNKIRKYLSLFVIFSLLSIGNLENLCKIYPNAGADNQTLLLWQYTASIGMMPFRDIFYPYGYLSYYSGQNILFAFLYFIITPILLVCIFDAFQKIYKSKLYSITSFTIFFLFIIFFTGFEIFTRYGFITVIAIIYAYIFYFHIDEIKKVIFGVGVFGGLIFALINDAGLYAYIVFILFATINKLVKSHFKIEKNLLISFIKEIILFSLGYIFGLVPFFIYLFETHSVIGFISYIASFRELAQFAKTPFFHSIFTVDNLFTLGILVITIMYLCYKFLFGDKKATLVTYMQIGFILVLLLLEQKSIIRSIDTQLTFIGLLLFFTLFNELRTILKKLTISEFIIFIYFINTAIIILFVIDLHPNDKFHIQYPSLNHVASVIDTFKNKSCIEKNMKMITSQNKDVFEVTKELPTLENFNKKVLTFPGEPIYYILLKQKPPYYPTIYEATPLAAQRDLISYIENQEIHYILYNYKTFSIHDEVPDTVRGRLLYAYIRTNFSIERKIKSYIIFKKKKNTENYASNKSLE